MLWHTGELTRKWLIDLSADATRPNHGREADPQIPRAIAGTKGLPVVVGCSRPFVGAARAALFSRAFCRVGAQERTMDERCPSSLAIAFRSIATLDFPREVACE